MKSDTHSAFGRGAWNCRFTLSRGQGALRSLSVVLAGLPRTAPRSPISRISRSTVSGAARPCYSEACYLARLKRVGIQNGRMVSTTAGMSDHAFREGEEAGARRG